MNLLTSEEESCDKKEDVPEEETWQESSYQRRFRRWLMTLNVRGYNDGG